MRCPDCGEDNNTIKHGIRNTDKGTVQKYFCKNCDTHFSSSKRKYTQYPEHVILFALEMYNLGYKGITSFSHSESIPRDTL